MLTDLPDLLLQDGEHDYSFATSECHLATAAACSLFPRDVVEAVGCHPIGKRRVLLANGREEEWPVGAVSLTLEGQELPTVCLIGPNGGPALLGAVTLEEFALSVDPVAKRLIPVRSYLT